MEKEITDVRSGLIKSRIIDALATLRICQIKKGINTMKQKRQSGYHNMQQFQSNLSDRIIIFVVPETHEVQTRNKELINVMRKVARTSDHMGRPTALLTIPSDWVKL